MEQRERSNTEHRKQGSLAMNLVSYDIFCVCLLFLVDQVFYTLCCGAICKTKKTERGADLK